jgi:protein-disulfide isomerase
MLIALAVAAAATTTVLARVQSPSQDELDKQFLAAWAQQIRADVRVPAAGAKLVVVKFNDWMCPGCRLAYQEFKPLLAKYQAMPGVLKYVEKDWPWNTACNQAATQTFGGHEASCNAAAVVRLAAGRGKRDLMIDWLFANQMLGVTDFAAAYAATLPEVRKDVADGIALNIRSTPTYFINGIRAVGADESTIPGHYFELALRYEYQKNGGR